MSDKSLTESIRQAPSTECKCRQLPPEWVYSLVFVDTFGYASPYGVSPYDLAEAGLLDSIKPDMKLELSTEGLRCVVYVTRDILRYMTADDMSDAIRNNESNSYVILGRLPEYIVAAIVNTLNDADVCEELGHYGLEPNSETNMCYTILARYASKLGLSYTRNQFYELMLLHELHTTQNMDDCTIHIPSSNSEVFYRARLQLAASLGCILYTGFPCYEWMTPGRLIYAGIARMNTSPRRMILTDYGVKLASIATSISVRRLRNIFCTENYNPIRDDIDVSNEMGQFFYAGFLSEQDKTILRSPGQRIMPRRFEDMSLVVEDSALSDEGSRLTSFGQSIQYIVDGFTPRPEIARMFLRYTMPGYWEMPTRTSGEAPEPASSPEQPDTGPEEKTTTATEQEPEMGITPNGDREISIIATTDMHLSMSRAFLLSFIVHHGYVPSAVATTLDDLKEMILITQESTLDLAVATGKGVELVRDILKNKTIYNPIITTRLEELEANAELVPWVLGAQDEWVLAALFHPSAGAQVGTLMSHYGLIESDGTLTGKGRLLKKFLINSGVSYTEEKLAYLWIVYRFSNCEANTTGITLGLFSLVTENRTTYKRFMFMLGRYLARGMDEAELLTKGQLVDSTLFQWRDDGRMEFTPFGLQVLRVLIGASDDTLDKLNHPVFLDGDYKQALKAGIRTDIGAMMFKAGMLDTVLIRNLKMLGRESGGLYEGEENSMKILEAIGFVRKDVESWKRTLDGEMAFQLIKSYDAKIEDNEKEGEGVKTIPVEDKCSGCQTCFHCAPQESRMGEELAREAIMIINGDRKDSYGDPKESFEKIAEAWSALFGVKVTAKQVALAMTMLKIIRESHESKRDNLVDMLGYIMLAREIE